MNTADAVPPYISVVVCTYNRVEILKGAVRTLCTQSGYRHPFEVIIVDNNSSDGTKKYSLDCSDKFEHVRYVSELQQGLSHARNRGLEEARGEYIAYVDDDCEMPDDYIAQMETVLHTVKPAVLCGPIYPLYKSSKPYWYKDKYAQYLLTEHSRSLDEHEYAIGCNMVFRRGCIELVGGFDPRFGMSGEDVGYGEETEVQVHIRKKMPNEVFYYDTRVYVNHLVRPEKMKLAWIMWTRYKAGISSNRSSGGKIIDAPTRIMVVGKSIKYILGMVKDAVVGLVKRDRDVYPYFQNYLYEHTFQYLRGLGKLHDSYRTSSGH